MSKMLRDDFVEETPSNILAKYYRAPGLQIKLPTNCKFMPHGSYELSMSDEVAVYPMRAADEMLMKSPDALMSGEAIEQMVRSCVPAIKQPRLVSTPDLDVILLAVRATTQGESLDIETECPKCKHKMSFTCSIPGLLSTAPEIPSDLSVRLSNDIVVYLRPYNLEDSTRISVATFKETKNIQMLDLQYGEDNTDPAIIEMKSEQIKKSTKILQDLERKTIIGTITMIVVPEGKVTDPKMIVDFYNNISSKLTGIIDAKVKEINDMGIDKSVPLVCESCSHKWKGEVQFDPASFFGLGS